ncbi:GDP-fucose synthetase [Marinomonas sp. UCMA 3892]|uniref:GDP-L-fucose synthase n=1 Tax=Marinomonas sp. UCMA 3892 TaxID=1972585 RepID=UPI00146BD73A|nr:GDP-fucose synthetase [Marinomonas sp. UCMA 3892]
MNLDSRVYVAGHGGMVGSAIIRQLKKSGYQHIVTRTSAELDLTNQTAVAAFFAEQKIDEVYLAAAKVGGIYANNTFPAEFIYQNLMIEANVIHQSYLHGVQKLLFLGSSCIYPKLASQPMQESALLDGYLEPTNEPYAVAKIAGIKLCESYNRQYGVDYRSVMPTNLYGPGDNYHPENSHVIPALIRRIHEAKEQGLSEVTIWGTGTPKREFLHVDDMAAASIFVMNLDKATYDSEVHSMESHINVGTGLDCSILEVTHKIAKVVGFNGDINTDTSKPDGAPRKLMNVDRLHRLGWESSIELDKGLQDAYDWFLKNSTDLRV